MIRGGCLRRLRELRRPAEREAEPWQVAAGVRAACGQAVGPAADGLRAGAYNIGLGMRQQHSLPCMLRLLLPGMLRLLLPGIQADPQRRLRADQRACVRSIQLGGVQLRRLQRLQCVRGSGVLAGLWARLLAAADRQGAQVLHRCLAGQLAGLRAARQLLCALCGARQAKPARANRLHQLTVRLCSRPATAPMRDSGEQWGL